MTNSVTLILLSYRIYYTLRYDCKLSLSKFEINYTICRERKVVAGGQDNLVAAIMSASTVSAAALAARRKREPKARKTQEERSAEMRLRLLDATLTSLELKGYSGTSMSTIAEIAGVSRGAIQHHYPEKNYIVAGALEFAASRIQSDILLAVEKLPIGAARLELMLDRFWKAAQTSPLPAMSDVRIAARTNDGLMAMILPIEYAMRERQRKFVAAAIGVELQVDQSLIPRIDALMGALRGLAFQLAYGWESYEIEAAWSLAKSDFVENVVGLASLGRGR
jgi:AcrR family transcriptional regulator